METVAARTGMTTLPRPAKPRSAVDDVPTTRTLIDQ